MPNPFLEPSPLPYELPPFADIRDEHYREAFDVGFAEQRAEVEAITSQAAPPTFENTVEALERSGGVLDRVATVFWSLVSADTTDFLDELETEIAPLYAAHSDSIRLNTVLYARIAALHAAPDTAWSAEQRYLVERWHTDMTLAGAGLDATSADRVRAINQRLAELTTTFDQNLQAETNELAVLVDDAAELDGLGATDAQSAASAAAERGHDGKYLITLPLHTGHPWLAQLTNRALRQRIMEASLSRGTRGNEHDNRAVVREIVQLRAERAGLLGFSTHAHVAVADATAKTPEAIAERLAMLAPAAAANAKREAETLRAYLVERGDEYELASWDWAFVTEQVRSAQLDVDAAALKPYFEAERVLIDGVFHAATTIYGVRFTERDDLAGYHPDVRVFEVHDEDGEAVGLYLLDLYTRDSKRGGAWMNAFVSQNGLLDQQPVVTNNLNVPKPPVGEPTLLTLDETHTLFHEFGHALHGLFARVEYPSVAGTNVPRDFVEFPSQVNEMWVLWPGIVERYARHVHTGEPLDPAVIERLRSAGTFNQGFKTTEYLAATVLDQAWHTLAPGTVVGDVEAFERSALESAGLADPLVPTRYSTGYFQHVFSGGYSAAYYSYIWSEVLDADTVAWFEEHGGATRENGERFRERLLGVGGAKDPLEAYRDFRGRDAEIGPLLKRRGLG